jgi:riboflavin synthase
MFTGIVEETGTIQAIDVHDDEAMTLTISCSAVMPGAAAGDSIAVSGVCLTVVALADGAFTADVMKQTLDHTALGSRRVGDRVNLERAARVDSRLGGHIVQGHVDGVGTVVAVSPAAHWTVLAISPPIHLLRYLVAQGSITVDGVSLTVASLDDGAGEFTVSLIPTTLGATTLGSLDVGDHVNLEVDVLAKYVERLLQPQVRPLGDPA